MDPVFQTLVLNVVTTIIPLVLAIAVHEYAHVAMARWLGDRTGEAQGRLTLNPLAHADPIWTVAVPTWFVISQTLAGAGSAVPFFGAGRPAPYDPSRFQRHVFGKRVTLRTGELLVAAAGPLSNVLLAAVTTLVLVGLVRGGFSLVDPASPAVLVFNFVLLNTGLALFNLIPIPPLDGSKVLMSLLPRRAAVTYEDIAGRLSWVLLLVVILGGGILLGPVQRFVAAGLHVLVA